MPPVLICILRHYRILSMNCTFITGSDKARKHFTMDVISILNGIKGKVLDAAHFDLLRSAYDLQNENIEQLKSNNEAIRENNILLRNASETLKQRSVGSSPRMPDCKSESKKGIW